MPSTGDSFCRLSSLCRPLKWMPPTPDDRRTCGRRQQPPSQAGRQAGSQRFHLFLLLASLPLGLPSRVVYFLLPLKLFAQNLSVGHFAFVSLPLWTQVPPWVQQYLRPPPPPSCCNFSCCCCLSAHNCRGVASRSSVSVLPVFFSVSLLHSSSHIPSLPPSLSSSATLVSHSSCLAFSICMCSTRIWVTF